MAGRYGLNLRPIYGDDEPTFGGGISRAIGMAVEEAEARRMEENEMAVRGARRFPGEQVSVKDRLRQIRGRLGAVFGGRPEEAPHLPAPGAPSAAPLPEAYGGDVPVPPWQDSAIRKKGGFIFDERDRPPAPVMTERPSLPTPTGWNPAARGGAPAARTRPQSIGAAIATENPDVNPDEVILRGRGGARYSLDPYAAEKRRASLERAEYDRRSGIEAYDKRREHEHEVSVIGEEAAHRRGNTTGLSYDERLGLLTAEQGSINARAAAERRVRTEIALQSARDRKDALEVRRLTALLASYDREAADAARGVPTGPDRIVDQPYAARADSAAADARAKAAAARGALGPKKTVPDQEAYNELLKVMSAEDIARRYQLAPGIRPR